MQFHLVTYGPQCQSSSKDCNIKLGLDKPAIRKDVENYGPCPQMIQGELFNFAAPEDSLGKWFAAPLIKSTVEPCHSKFTETGVNVPRTIPSLI